MEPVTLHYQAWVFSCGVSHESRQKAADYSHDLCATGVPTAYLASLVITAVHRICSQVRLLITLFHNKWIALLELPSKEEAYLYYALNFSKSCDHFLRYLQE